MAAARFEDTLRARPGLVGPGTIVYLEPSERDAVADAIRAARALMAEAPVEEWDGGSLGYLGAELLDALARLDAA